MRPIGQALGGRTHNDQPKPRHRAGSHRVGSCERGWYQPLDRKARGKVMAAARRYELVRRPSGARSGPLGHIALEALSLLLNLLDARTGRLEPSISFIMSRLKRSRDAVTRALSRLRAAGFLDWFRRVEPVETEGPGPRLKQASNAYRISIPKMAARLLPSEPPLLPDDLLSTMTAAREAREELPTGDYIQAAIQDDALSKALLLMSTRVRPAS